MFFIVRKYICELFLTMSQVYLGGRKMGTYTLKSIGSANDYMTIERELDDGFVVRIVRDRDGYDEVTTDFISKTLFDSCVRTGYITKIEEPVKLAANA